MVLRKYFCLAFVLVVIFNSTITKAQPALYSDPYDSVSHIIYGMNYLSDNVYLGRRDTIPIPYYSPYFGYEWKSGFYTFLALSATTSKRTHVDLAVIEAGYENDYSDNFLAGATMNVYYYNRVSNGIRANARGSAKVFAQYKNEWLQPMLTFNVNRNKKSTDFVASLQADHVFRFSRNTLNIMPAAALNIGTQHYLDEYFVNRLVSKDKSQKLKKVNADAARFKALNYELSLKTTFRASHWLFTCIPTYSIPLNPATLVFPAATFTETVSNTFYLELDICHR